MDSSLFEKYEVVIGLEIHVQLNTRSKIFASDPTSFGDAPNSNISTITLAHPGTLPKLNREVVGLAAKMGLACGSQIARTFIFDRKNYFYPDLPKGYQLTQDRTPICVGGHIRLGYGEDANTRKVQLHKIHLEEDAGKSIHDGHPDMTGIDYNRAGVPLIEIVTDPDIYSDEEAMQVLSSVRRTVRYLDVSDANMEEGSMRCDANISVRIKGSATLGSKVEIKNMNSMRNVGRAIRFEFDRQCRLLEEEKQVVSETRTFNAEDGSTSGMRMKEELNDYRYFPEPDLSEVVISDQWLDDVRSRMPALPEQYFQQFVEEYGLPVESAMFFIEEQEMAIYASKMLSKSKLHKQVGNWLMGPVQSFLKENRIGISEFPIKQDFLLKLIALVESGNVSHSVAVQKLFPALLANPAEDPQQLASRMDLLQNSDLAMIQPAVDEVLRALPQKVKEYQNGKKGLLGLFMGEVMKKTKGTVDPKLANRLIRESLETMVL